MSRRASITALVGLVLIGALIAWNLQLSPVMTAIGANVLRTSSSIALGYGWIGSEVDPFGERAPLMGSLVGLLGLVGLPPIMALRVAASGGFVVAVAGTGAMLRTLRVRPDLLAVIGVGLAPLVLLLRASSGELYFVGATMVALAALARHLALPARRWLLIAALAAGMAGLAHYMAVLVLFPLVVGVAIIQRRPWHVRLRDTLWTGLVCAVPIGIWMARNQFLTGHLTGMSRTDPRVEVAMLSTGQHAVGLGRTVLFDLTGLTTMGTQGAVYHGIPPTEMMAAVAVAAAVVVLALIAVAGSTSDLWRWAREQRRRPSAAAFGWLVAGVYVAWYVAVVIGVWSVANNDRIQTRFMVALYPAVVAGFAALPSLLGNVSSRRWPPYLAFAALLVLLGVQGYKASRILVDNPSDEVVPDQWLGRQKVTEWNWKRWGLRHQAAEQFKLRSNARKRPVMEQ